MKIHRNIKHGTPMGIASILLLGIGTSRPVHAEGHINFGVTALGDTAWGVNRRVSTYFSGYVEVGGTADILFSLPSVNQHGNSPSVYLGGNIGGTEFDAGLQYEQEALSPAPGADPIAPGWFEFIRGGGGINNGYTNPRVWGMLPGASAGTPLDSVPWRYPSQMITSALRMEFVEDGAVSLYVGAMGGTFFHYPGGNSGVRAADQNNAVAPYQRRPADYFTDADRTSSNVKRVVAMTRDAPYNAEPDNATMRAVFSGGRVRRYNEPTLNGTVGNYWNVNDVDQSESGYDAPGNGAQNRQAWDKRFQRNGQWFLTPVTPPAGSESRSRTIVEFPSVDVGNIAARAQNSTSHGAREEGNSRYTRETVRINLRSATGIGANDVD